MDVDRTQRLGSAAIGPLLFSFSLPAIVGMVAQALYNIIDRIFVGQALGPSGIAGITIAFSFMLLMMSVGMLIGFGAAALVSIRLGQQEHDEAERVLGNALVLLILGAAALTVVGLVLLDPLLWLFGATEETLPFAHDYLQVITFGTVFQVVGFGLNAVIRGEGNPRIAMISMLVSVALNAVLAPIFIFGLGWGMRGAGLATVLAQAATAVWVVGHFLSGRSHLVLRARNLRLHWPLCLKIAAIGSPPALMQIAASILNSLLNRQLEYYGAELGPDGGTLSIAVVGIVYPLLLMVLMPIFGINQGAQPIIGYNYGAEHFTRVRHTLRLAMLAATSISFAGFVVAMGFPAEVIRLFGSQSPALVAAGVPAMRIAFLMMPIIGFQVIGSGYFLAVGKPKHGILLGLSRQLLFLIPALLILPQFFGIVGVWAALPIADLASAVLTSIWLGLEFRQLRRVGGKQELEVGS